LDLLHIRTSVAEFGVIGRLHADPHRPTLLVVNGVFPTKDHLHDVIDAYPGANVLIVNLPGMLGTPWSGRSAAELALGLEELIARLVGDGPLVVAGSSTGNLVSLELRSRNIRRHICIEPFFETKDLWPFIDWARAHMAAYPKDVAVAKFIWDFFGIRADVVENRDYRHLLQGVSIPTDVIMGSVPLLPRRDLNKVWPSLTSAADRAAMAAVPQMVLHEGPLGTGHALMLTPTGNAFAKTIIHAALLEAAKTIPTPKGA
jgi:hypothetical protein